MAQLAVESVKRPKLLEGGAWPKYVPVPRRGEGKAVRRKTVIVVMLQTVQRRRLICDDKATCFEQVELLLVGVGVLYWLMTCSFSWRYPEMKKPPLVRIVERRGGCY
jgi:hypothetical protein